MPDLAAYMDNCLHCGGCLLHIRSVPTPCPLPCRHGRRRHWMSRRARAHVVPGRRPAARRPVPRPCRRMPAVRRPSGAVKFAMRHAARNSSRACGMPAQARGRFGRARAGGMARGYENALGLLPQTAQNAPVWPAFGDDQAPRSSAGPLRGAQGLWMRTRATGCARRRPAC